MRKVIAAALFLFLTISLSAKERKYGYPPLPTGYNYMQNEISLQGSMFSGIGISYKYAFESGFHIKLTGFAWRSNDLDVLDNYYDKRVDIFIDYGLEFQMDLKTAASKRIYLLLGYFSWYQEGLGKTNYGFEYPYYALGNSFERRFSIGPGLGCEYIAWDHLTFHFSAGITYSHVIRNGFSTQGTKHFSSESTKELLEYSYGGGIGYRF